MFQPKMESKKPRSSIGNLEVDEYLYRDAQVSKDKLVDECGWYLVFTGVACLGSGGTKGYHNGRSKERVGTPG